ADGGEVLSGFTREIHLKDHLGNVRAVFDYSKLQSENHYYPFGLPIHNLCTTTAPEGKENRYLYNGKELQDDLGLNWMDYGARFYDAGIGKWHSGDPLADKYFSLSPYSYCANNPIIFIDPDGKEITVNRIQEEGKKDVVQIKVSAFLVNTSSKEMSSSDLINCGVLIGEQIVNSFGGEYENATVEVSCQIIVVSDISKTKDSHMFMISDPSDKDLKNGSYAGASNVGGRVAKINADIIDDACQLQRTSAHEFGHMAGLDHPDKEKDPNVKEAASNDKDNLMHQSINGSGTEIIEEQINKIVTINETDPNEGYNNR
ncbi:MAG: RHS repeat-associated core domain-containing protein, partial [Clostridiaceae bacterium]|nr:RHS repeat-associated core domain-containing protein [Clostridiaceae bacterium]